MKKSLLSLLVFANCANASGLIFEEATMANGGGAGAGNGVYTKSAAASWTNPASMSHMGETKTTVNIAIVDLSIDYIDDNPNPQPFDYDVPYLAPGAGGGTDDGSGIPDYTATGNGSADTTAPSFGIFHSRQINDKWHIGINLGASGGGGVEFGTDWDGATHLDESEVAIFQLNPNVSYRVNDKLSIGLGGQLSYGTLEMQDTIIKTKKEDSFATGFTLGVMYKEENWSLGFGFRSKLDHEFEDVNVTVISDQVNDFLNNRTEVGPGENANTGIVTTSFIIPEIYDISASYNASAQTTVYGSVQMHRWSEYTETALYNYEFLYLPDVPDIEQWFDDNGIDKDVPTAVNRDWDDVYRYSMAVEHVLNRDWTLKAGYAYETSTTEDPTEQWTDVPSGKQMHYSFGASTMLNGKNVDIYYQYSDLGSVDIDRTGAWASKVSGTYDSEIHMVGVNFSF